MKTLYLLIGPKGAGKTYIGRLIGRRIDIHFLAVEPLWLSLEAGTDGWLVEEAAIDNAFISNDKVMIETLGAGEGCLGMLARLEKKYRLNYIKVACNADICLQRVQTRDSTAQISIPLEKIAEYNAIAATVVFPWNAVIENSDPASEAEILAAIRQSEN